MRTPKFRYGLYRLSSICAGSPAPTKRHQFHVSELCFTQREARAECARRNKTWNYPRGSGWAFSKLSSP